MKNFLNPRKSIIIIKKYIMQFTEQQNYRPVLIKHYWKRSRYNTINAELFKFWDEIVMIIAYLKNITLMKKLKSFFSVEFWNNKKTIVYIYIIFKLCIIYIYTFLIYIIVYNIIYILIYTNILKCLNVLCITIYISIYIRYLKISLTEKIFIIGYIMENTLYIIQNLAK